MPGAGETALRGLGTVSGRAQTLVEGLPATLWPKQSCTQAQLTESVVVRGQSSHPHKAAPAQGYGKYFAGCRKSTLKANTVLDKGKQVAAVWRETSGCRQLKQRLGGFASTGMGGNTRNLYLLIDVTKGKVNFCFVLFL